MTIGIDMVAVLMGVVMVVVYVYVAVMPHFCVCAV